MILRRFTVELDDGRSLHGDVRVPDGPLPRTAVVLVHGFKGFKDWGFLPYVGGRLAAAGHAVVSFNFSGSGVPPGQDEVTDLEAFAANTLTREVAELGVVLERVRHGDLLPRSPRAVGVLGYSRGGGDAIVHAGGCDDVDALVTWGSVATFERFGEDVREEWRRDGRVFVMNARTGIQLPLDVGFLDDLDAHAARLDVTARAARVRAPWLIVHGLDDLTVFAEEARELARARPGARLHLIEDAGHRFGADHPFQGPARELLEAIEVTERHFARHLSAVPSALGS